MSNHPRIQGEKRLQDIDLRTKPSNQFARMIAQESFYWVTRRKHAGFDRSELPQIPDSEIPELIKTLELKHRRVLARDLKPAQKHISKSKVYSKIDTRQYTRKYIISSDGYLLDGHHSWMSLIPNNEAMDVYQSDLNIQDLVALMRDPVFGFVTKTINENHYTEKPTDDDNSVEYCSATYQRINRLYRSVKEVDKNRARSLFQLFGYKHGDTLKSFCSRTRKSYLVKLEQQLRNLQRHS